MPRTSFVGPAFFVLILFSCIGSVRADYLFNWDPTVPRIFSDNSGMQINLSDNAQLGPVSGARSMVVTALSTFVNPDVYGPDTFNQGQQTGLKLTITDGQANGSVIFGIGFQGGLYPDGSSTLGMSFLDGTTKGLTVNGNPYTVALSSAGKVPGEVLATITPRAAPKPGDNGGSGNPGSGSGGNTGGSGSGGPSAPEPSGLILAGLGLSGVVYGFIRRRGSW